MSSAWRQGSLISPDDAVRLGLIAPEVASDSRVLIVSHSCDIAADPFVEPKVEVLIGRVASPEQAKKFDNGHSIRQLALPALLADGSVEFHVYPIQSRVLVGKAELEKGAPWSACTIDPKQGNLLRRWLAQRYARAEFPDAFVAWLHETKIDEAIESVAKTASPSLRAISFDLDDDSERIDPDDPYELAIYLVYLANEPNAKSAAEVAATKLAGVFQKRCVFDGSWKYVELIKCQAMSDESFSLAAFDEFRRWRLEHRSIKGEPTVGPE